MLSLWSFGSGKWQLDGFADTAIDATDAAFAGTDAADGNVASSAAGVSSVVVVVGMD